MAPVADGASGRWFTPAFCTRAPAVVDGLIDGLRACDPRGYAACCQALAAADLRDEVGAIAVRTLLVAGRGDPVTTVEDARWLPDRIAESCCVELDPAHLSNVEAETAFNLHLERFLA